LPPTEVQKYESHLQDADNEVVQHFFQYSQCTGKKRALCIGINYIGLECELKGCINDVQNIQNFLISHYGYKKEDIFMLTDDATDPRGRPTRANMLQAMQELVRDSQPHDSLFFHYSGHGAQIKDTAGDEVDGFDDVIYPVDYQDYDEGYIVDDLIHEIMVKPLPAGCRLTAIFDACHSGTVMDLPYVYSTKGKIKEPSLTAEVSQGLLTAFNSYARGNKNAFNDMGLPKMSMSDMRKAERIAKATRTSPADVVLWSGCKDSQAAADANGAGQASGAMSYAFTTALNVNKHQSYRELLVAIRNILKSEGFIQKPQLSSSHPMDTSIMFIC
ncbi:peptidase C14, caspase domain-containing protein, partial [Pholiota molesta]